MPSFFQKALPFAAALMILSACATDPAKKFRAVPPDLEAVVEATNGQFMNRDAAAMGAIITEDFSGWPVCGCGSCTGRFFPNMSADSSRS